MALPPNDGEANSTAAEPSISIVFVLGLPGAGKGTMCSRLATDLDWCHVSVGDYLRELSKSEEAVSDAAFGALSLAELRTHLQARDLLPAETVAAVVAHKINKERNDGHRRFLVDSFPRNLETAEAFERRVAHPTAVLLFVCPKHVAKTRFVERMRGDDDSAIFEKRYEEYQRLNGDILARYAPVLKTLSTTDGEDKTYGNLRELAEGVLGREK
ncbi:hypothetical protein LTR36_006046 [Oleoguttula mirabilis]|uniref:P-loop containing nucleoside triphosphate hydrolase protein n=1 Tax=Oleoguttula mirabilis TaxID=1507867 RepID=A0AAV9JD18_9PEZI|nr:hypothetical protein LTR36_006046 [Oleoguttula mirabilis]